MNALLAASGHKPLLGEAISTLLFTGPLPRWLTALWLFSESSKSMSSLSFSALISSCSIASHHYEAGQRE